MAVRPLRVSRLSNHYCALLCGLLLLAAPWQGLMASQRIASLNLCTDQLLLLLADRDRIASITYWSLKPESAYLYERAKGLPINHGLVEEVVPLQPDLVLAGQFTDPVMLGVLRGLEYRVEVVEVPRSMQRAEQHIIEFGAMIGESARAEQVVEEMQQRLADLRSARPREEWPLAVIYAANGITAGSGTLMNEIVEAAGFRNLADELGIQGYGTLSLEQLVAAEPQLLILDTPRDGNEDSIAHSYLQHSVLQSLLQRVETVSLAPKYTVCVGPMVVDAVEQLAEYR